MNSSDSHDTRVTEGAGGPRTIALDWYDGPISGFVERRPGESYGFALLSRVTAPTRVFSLHRMGAPFEELVELLRGFEEPRWPIWIPFRTLSEESWERETSRLRQVARLHLGVSGLLAAEGFQAKSRLRWALARSASEGNLMSELIHSGRDVEEADLDRFS